MRSVRKVAHIRCFQLQSEHTKNQAVQSNTVTALTLFQVESRENRRRSGEMEGDVSKALGK